MHTTHETLELLDQAHAHARRYVETVAERPVFPTPDSLAALSAFDEPLRPDPSPPAEALTLLEQIGAPATVAQTAGRYFGFVNGGALPVGLAARWMADTWDQNAAHYVMSPIASKLEEVCERWLVELLGLPTGAAQRGS